MASGDTDTSVKVAVRIRPQNAREQIDMCRVCTYCTPDTPQIVLGKDKAFTYDYVFDTVSHQDQIYSTCVQELVSGCFNGYNATVLAYGQTGSGKTYTMGTGFDMTILPDELGMIPRAVGQLFSSIEESKRRALDNNDPLPHFEVKTQFLELYNEEIIDLLEDQNKGKLRIHEDGIGNIYVAGATELAVTSEEETLACLKRGALSRTVGSTNMNAQSSRSHAIFSLLIVHQRVAVKNSVVIENNEDSSSEAPEDNEESSSSSGDWETLKAKFHFVDLAGSERLKRTGATGERAKEGISINCGLLALGNVISALGDKAKKGSHVPYRDSKLTRLLQDSLGGNSRTLMIACISPTDRDFMETLNTLKYSNRARNIKNKVVVNQDKMSQQLTALRSKIQQLEVELQEFKSGRMVVSGDGSVVMNDMASEITMLRTENDKLRLRIKAMQQVVESQSTSIASLTAERDCLMMGHQDESTGQVVANSERDSSSSNFTLVIQGYIIQIEELKSKLILSESMARQTPHLGKVRSAQSLYSEERPLVRSATRTDLETDHLLKLAKDNIEKLKERGRKDILLDSKSISQKKSHEEGAMSSDADSSLEESTDEGSEDTEETTTVQMSSSDESDSDRDETASLASSVAELSSEINLKQQLVDQLEKAQKNIYSMKSQYEEKMQVLQQQIKSIESERDRVLKDIASQRSQERNDGKVKEIRSKYERQLNDLKAELKTLKTAKKEHAKAIRKNAQHERDLKIMKNELLEMKKQRVKMLNKMREDANRRKMDDAKRTKEIRQLQKERRTKEHKIKLLESDAKRKELVLKRRQEELAALRRNNRYKRDRQTPVNSSQQESSQTFPQSRVEFAATTSGLNSTAGSTSLMMASETGSGYGATVVFRKQTGSRDEGRNTRPLNKRRMSSIFSSESAKKKWRNLEKKILDATMKRQTMANLSKDMDTWIQKRDNLSHKIDELRRQKEDLLQCGRTEDVSSEVAGIEEDMDSLSANIEYVQENIVELQNDLIAMDDVKCDGDTVDSHSLISSCSPKEAKYLLEHLLDLVLNLGVKASQMESDVKSLEARLKASEQSAEIMQTLSSPQVSSVTLPLATSKLKHLIQCRELYGKSALAMENASKKKALEEVDGRKIVSNPQKMEVSPKLRHRSGITLEIPSDRSVEKEKEKQQIKVTRVSKESTPEEEDKLDDKVTLRRRRGGSGGSADYKQPMKKKLNLLSNDAHSGMSINSCPPSPNLGGKLSRSLGSDGGVWSRLASSSNTSTDSSKGILQPEKLETRKYGVGKLLHCTHTASGHSASVLSVCSTQNYLFSASQDRTVKIWNLKTCTELLSLEKHFSYVRCVRFCPKNNIIFTASQSLIKLWDMRHHRARCIKTFGLNAANGVSVGSEYAVQDLIVSPSGDTLYSAAGNFINIWDLRKSGYLGRFVGHNGALCALVIKGNLMATGSRDRLIKLFDLEIPADTSAMISQPSICTLYPPHYDAVLSLALYKDLLFSSCGVTIKQWDIKERSLKQALDGAHSPGSTINSLAIFNSPMTPLLVSGCKGGTMKLWNPETCGHYGEIPAHKGSINSICTNGTCVFTASHDKTVKIWRPSPQDS